jgi:uncharacterized protein
MYSDQLSQAQTKGREVDVGLKKYMSNIYKKMALGVLVTAIVAMIVGSSPMLLEMFLGGPQKYLVIFAPLAIIWFGFNPMTMKASQLMAAFLGVSVAYGISFATIAVLASADLYFAQNVARAFFIATAMFGGLSIYGYTTKADLSAVRTFAVMGIWGLIAASVMNIFFQSSAMSLIISGASIVLFSGITVWQTQDMKRMYYYASGQEMTERLAWAAALNLYISFIALFQHILHLLNQR